MFIFILFFSNYVLSSDPGLELVDSKLYSNTYLHDNSTFNNTHTTRLYFNPVNYYNGTNYTAINATVIDTDCDLDYCVREGIYFVDFESYSDDLFPIVFKSNQTNLSLDLGNLSYIYSDGGEDLVSEVINVSGYSNESEFIYLDVYGGVVDLKYDYKGFGLKEKLILKNESILDGASGPLVNSSYLKFEVYFSTDKKIYDVENGIEWNKNSTLNVSGRIDFRDDANNTLFYFPSAYAMDDNLSRIKLNYTLENNGGDLSVSVLVPYVWLAEEDRVYPIEVDPSILVYLLDLVRHGEVSRSEYGGDESYEFFDHWDYPAFYIGTFKGLDLDYTSYRAYIQWRDSEIQNNFDPEDTILDVYMVWNDIVEYFNIDTVYFYEMDEDDPNDLTPNTQSEMADLYNVINDGNSLGVDYSPDEGSYNLIDFDYDAVNAMYNSINNGESFIVSMKGECCDVDSVLGMGGKGYDFPPYLEVEFIDYVEQEQCDIPDGSEYGNNCDCDTDAGCEVYGDYYCDQGPGPDACEFNPTCDGIISAIVEDSSMGAIGGAYVYLNGVSQGQTDDFGSKEVEILGVGCGDLQNIQVKCDDDSTVCDTQSTYVDNPDDWDYDSLTFTCDTCLSGSDLFIDIDDISFRDQSNQINVTLTVHTYGVEESDVKVSMTKVCETDYITEDKFIPTVTSSNDYEISFLSDLEGCSKVIFQVDPNNDVWESDELNNNAEQFVIDPVNVYLSTDTSYHLIDDEIEDFISDFAQSVSQEDSQLEIYIGRSLAPNLDDGWGIEDNVIVFGDRKEGVPYNGMVGKKFISEKPRLYVFGNEIDGTLAAVRELVKERVLLLNEQTLYDSVDPIYLAEDNMDAISVFDYLHNDENYDEYRQNNANFAEIVNNVLKRNTFNIAIKRVLTANDQTALRMKHLNSELSPAYRNLGNPKPVVLSQGLWSNLFSWEDFGFELARGALSGEEGNPEESRDTWLIEMIGGPNTECDNCPNYNYSDLVEYYWPALISGVEAYSGKDEVDYVGFSNGCRVALSSLEEYQDSGKSGAGYYYDGEDWFLGDLSANVVDTFVGVGCPGAFEELTPVTTCLGKYGDDVADHFEGNGVYHLSSYDVKTRMIIESAIHVDLGCLGVSAIYHVFTLGEDNNKISANLLKNYSYFMDSDQDQQPGSGINLTKFYLHYGMNGFAWDNDNDYIVPEVDELAIFNNIAADIKNKFDYHLRHDQLSYDRNILNKMMEELN